MPKFIVNTNISKDKVPEPLMGELTQQLSKAMGKPAQVRTDVRMFSLSSQLCLCNELFLSNSLYKLIYLVAHQYLELSLCTGVKYLFAVT